MAKSGLIKTDWVDGLRHWVYPRFLCLVAGGIRVRSQVQLVVESTGMLVAAACLLDEMIELTSIAAVVKVDWCEDI